MAHTSSTEARRRRRRVPLTHPPHFAPARPPMTIRQQDGSPALRLRLDLPVRLMSGHAVPLLPRRRRRGGRRPHRTPGDERRTPASRDRQGLRQCPRRSPRAGRSHPRRKAMGPRRRVTGHAVQPAPRPRLRCRSRFDGARSAFSGAGHRNRDRPEQVGCSPLDSGRAVAPPAAPRPSRPVGPAGRRRIPDAASTTGVHEGRRARRIFHPLRFCHSGKKLCHPPRNGRTLSHERRYRA